MGFRLLQICPINRVILGYNIAYSYSYYVIIPMMIYNVEKISHANHSKNTYKEKCPINRDEFYPRGFATLFFLGKQEKQVWRDTVAHCCEIRTSGDS